MPKLDRIVSAYARQVTSRVVQRVIRALQGVTNARLSGDDSGLLHAWDELCVQIQFERSIFWDAYEHTVDQFIQDEMKGLSAMELDAIWLQTDNGFNWLYDDEEEREQDPYIHDDVVYYLRHEVYGKAVNWSNPRIRAYLGQN